MDWKTFPVWLTLHQSRMGTWLVNKWFGWKRKKSRWEELVAWKIKKQTWVSPSHQPLEDRFRIFTYWPTLRESCSLLCAVKGVTTTASSGVLDIVITAESASIFPFSFWSSWLVKTAESGGDGGILAVLCSPIVEVWVVVPIVVDNPVWNE